MIWAMGRPWAGPSDGRQAFAAGPAAIAQDGAPALLAVAGKKAMLPLAAHFGRLILSFHKFKSFAAPKIANTLARFGNIPGTGTREHNSEEMSVKQVAERLFVRNCLESMTGNIWLGAAVKPLM
jgi:hypothetical protein